MRAAGHAIAAALAATPGMARVLTRAALADIGMKSANFARVASAVAARCPSRAPLVETNMGLSNRLRLLVPASKHYLLFGSPEQNLAERGTLALTRILARRSEAFLDVGANEGLFTFAVAADLPAADHQRVHLFEPDADLFARLVANLQRNAIAAHAHNVAVSDTVGRQTFYRNFSDDLSGSLTDHFAAKHDTVAVEIETTTLAHHLERHDVRHACIKIDVEGAGVAVWSGLKPALERVDWVIMEIIGPEAQAQLPRQIIADTGWTAYYIRDFDLVQSKAGEFDYVPPFYNWLFARRGEPQAMSPLLAGGRFQVLPAAA